MSPSGWPFWLALVLASLSLVGMLSARTWVRAAVTLVLVGMCAFSWLTIRLLPRALNSQKAAMEQWSKAYGEGVIEMSDLAAVAAALMLIASLGLAAIALRPIRPRVENSSDEQRKPADPIAPDLES